MKNKQSKGLSLSLSLSANPIHLIKDTFSAVQRVFAGVIKNSNKLTLKLADSTKLTFSAPVNAPCIESCGNE